MLNITESKSTTDYNDISTIYCYLNEPEYVSELHTKKCDIFSDFSNHYPYNGQREFIEKLDLDNPGKYSHYLISWSHSR